MLAAVLGPRVGSVGWDFVDAAWGLRAKVVVTRGEGSTDLQTASLLALPGMAVDSQNRWGLQVSVDDAVSENVPGAQAAHTTFDVAVPGVTTPKPGGHLRSGAHCRHRCWILSMQYQPGLQAHTRFCSRVQARVSTCSELQRESQLRQWDTQFQSWVNMPSSQGAHTVSEVGVQWDWTW